MVEVETRGYGSALMGGIAAARGEFVIMGDADDSYDFTALRPFVAKLRDGYDLVMGNRFLGGIQPGAMPALHHYLGNPILTAVGRLFFGNRCGDFHCGLRGFRKDAVARHGLTDKPGWSLRPRRLSRRLSSECEIAEVPTQLFPDGRSRRPHLRTWSDGWRHLRFLFLIVRGGSSCTRGCCSW